MCHFWKRVLQTRISNCIPVFENVIFFDSSPYDIKKNCNNNLFRFIASTEAKFENILEHSMVKDLYESIAPETVPASNSFDFALALAADG